MNGIRKNNICFVGLPSCGYVYESAKSCFLACPSDEKYSLVVDTIKDVVEAKHYECHVALKSLNPGSFAFCTKICSKIIQSQFCIVLLDPSSSKTKKGLKYPNPNVHFEYGMMLSQNKYVIPLLEENEDLSFNISPLDTIKYSNSNLKIKLNSAIDNAIERANKNTFPENIPIVPEILTFYSIKSYQLSNIVDTKLFKYLYDFGFPLGFYFFNKNNIAQYKYVGIFELEEPRKAILHTKILIDNIVSTYKMLILNLPVDNKDENTKKYEYLIKQISIDLIISSVYDKEEIKQKIYDLIENKTYSYNISIYYRSDITDYINTQYEQIGVLKVIKEDI